jgi:lysyl-tRNA synthetase class II
MVHSRFENLQDARLAKLEALRGQAIDPFGSAFPDRTLSACLHQQYAQATAAELDQTVAACRVAGRLVTLRPQGRAGFAHLQDGKWRRRCWSPRWAVRRGGSFATRGSQPGTTRSSRRKLIRPTPAWPR